MIYTHTHALDLYQKKKVKWKSKSSKLNEWMEKYTISLSSKSRVCVCVYGALCSVFRHYFFVHFLCVCHTWKLDFFPFLDQKYWVILGFFSFSFSVRFHNGWWVVKWDSIHWIQPKKIFSSFTFMWTTKKTKNRKV